MVVALLVGCGGGQTKPAAPEPDPVEEAAEQEEEAAPEPAATSTGPVSEFGERPPPIPEAWELKQGDCDALAGKYEQLLLALEMKKLEERNIQQKYRASAESNVKDTAKKGADTWKKACDEIVGTVQPKNRWECAYAATTFERFTGCLDGKFDNE